MRKELERVVIISHLPLGIVELTWLTKGDPSIPQWFLIGAVIFHIGALFALCLCSCEKPDSKGVRYNLTIFRLLPSFCWSIWSMVTTLGAKFQVAKILVAETLFGVFYGIVILVLIFTYVQKKRRVYPRFVYPMPYYRATEVVTPVPTVPQQPKPEPKPPVPTRRQIMCHSCSGRGRQPHSSCNGRGSTNCFNCGGSGRTSYINSGSKFVGSHSCGGCCGSGTKTCFGCSSGSNSCPTCYGTGRIWVN